MIGQSRDKQEGCSLAGDDNGDGELMPLQLLAKTEAQVCLGAK